jgi:hypothetical protein
MCGRSIGLARTRLAVESATVSIIAHRKPITWIKTARSGAAICAVRLQICANIVDTSFAKAVRDNTIAR